VEYPERTAWYRYTPETNGFVAADPNNYWYFVAAYTGSNLGYLTEVGCRYYGSPLPIAVEAGTSYYFQVGSWAWRPGEINFNFYEAQPPTADFYWWPWEPSMYDSASFCDMSEDWLYIGYSEFWWDFGDGVIITGNCVSHQFPTDGDFTVYHNAQTIDGRTDPDGVTHTVSVRTHDVAAVRIAAPKSASAGQTRTITVYIKNNRYPEQVEVQLYKTVPGGYELVGVTNQAIPVRSGNRTTPVAFLYTFTQGDADIGKVSFKAIVYLLEANDALPADNEAISPPTKVQ
jgi:hypothetical protein